METKRYNIKLSERSFEEVKNPNASARVTISIDRNGEEGINTHKIILPDIEFLHVGNWYFLPYTIFCRNSEEEGLRIEISATNLNDNEKYDFCVVDSYVPQKAEYQLFDYIMNLIVSIAHNDAVEEFDKLYNGTNIRRIKNNIL